MVSSNQVVIALIAARNEGSVIKKTIASLFNQSRPPDIIFVVANNCNDNTAKVARDCGARVLEMEHNYEAKAGALNYALEMFIPYLKDEDCVLIMDADTCLSKNLVQNCLKTLDSKPLAGAAGSIFTGRKTKSFLGKLQTMEYWRYKRQLHRNGDKAFVLSGTASIFRVKALRQIKQARLDRKILKGKSYYDTTGLTEDNEITLALLKLGFECPIANDAISETDVMESLGALFKQRERWYRGALVNLKSYGRTLPWYMRWTYWKQQLGLFASLLFMTTWIVLLAISPLFGGLEITWQWAVPLCVLSLERVVTIWNKKSKIDRVIAALVLPEMVYSIFLLLIYGVSLINFIFHKKSQWYET